MNNNIKKFVIKIPFTQRKLVKEKELVQSIIGADNHKRQLDVMKESKREYLNTLVSMTKHCYSDRYLLQKYSPKDQKYIKSKQDEVVKALDKIKTSNLKKDQMIKILSNISVIDDGKIFRKLLKSYITYK